MALRWGETEGRAGRQEGVKGERQVNEVDGACCQPVAKWVPICAASRWLRLFGMRALRNR